MFSPSNGISTLLGSQLHPVVSLFLSSDTTALTHSFMPHLFSMTAFCLPNQYHLDNSNILWYSPSSMRYIFGVMTPRKYSQTFPPHWCWSLLNYYKFLVQSFQQKFHFNGAAVLLITTESLTSADQSPLNPNAKYTQRPSRVFVLCWNSTNQPGLHFWHCS